jgi:hypothetical protein
MSRELRVIAAEIRTTWGRNTSRHAMPYLIAMMSLKSVDEPYYADSGRSVVQYFLANAGGWRGEDARRLKRELKELLK